MNDGGANYYFLKNTNATPCLYIPRRPTQNYTAQSVKHIEIARLLRTLTFPFIPTGGRHREGDQDVHQRPVGGRTQRQSWTLSFHACGVYRQVRELRFSYQV
jgi:hypothetical protein